MQEAHPTVLTCFNDGVWLRVPFESEPDGDAVTVRRAEAQTGPWIDLAVLPERVPE